MLFGHQHDVNQPQTAATDQGVQDYVEPEVQAPQTVAPHSEPAAHAAPAPQAPATGVNPLAVDPATGASLPVVPQDSPGPVDTPAVDEHPSVLDQPPASGAGEAPVPEASAAPAPEPDSAPVFSEDAGAALDSGTPFSAQPAPAPDQTAGMHQVADAADQPAASGEEHGTALMQGVAPASAAATPMVNLAQTQQQAGFDQPQGDNSLLELKQQAIAQLSPLISHLDQDPEEKFRTTMMLLQSTDNPALLHEAYTAAQAIPDEKARAQALLDVVNEINYFTQQQDTQAA